VDPDGVTHGDHGGLGLQVLLSKRLHQIHNIFLLL
jgi:hypothetical protein